MTRRKKLLWTAAAIATIALLLGSWAFWLEPASLTVVDERVDLPWSASGPLRIAILTDLHVGSPFNGMDKLRRVVERTNAARPDIICILGDLLSNGPRGARSQRPGFITPEQVAPELAKLRAPVIPSQFGVRFSAGHIIEGGRHLYVSTGIGTSIIPVRFRVPPAITVLTLE